MINQILPEDIQSIFTNGYKRYQILDNIESVNLFV